MKIIYAIPGLGTTKELYRNIRVPDYTLKVLDWPLPERKNSLKDYASKFLDQIDQSSPVNLLGVSFGGMLCTELSEIIPARKVVLISSCRNHQQFPNRVKLFRWLPVHRIVPDQLVRVLAKTKRKFLGFEKSFEPVFHEMIDAMPANYFSCCINYIVCWERKTNTAVAVQIHGTSDKLLPHKKIPSCYSIKDGSHSMVLNRADEINNLLNLEFNGL